MMEQGGSDKGKAEGGSAAQSHGTKLANNLF
jgi:hypothetical protein